MMPVAVVVIEPYLELHLLVVPAQFPLAYCYCLELRIGVVPHHLALVHEQILMLALPEYPEERVNFAHEKTKK